MDRTQIFQQGPERMLGRYQILAEIGRGGMSTVFRATDPVLKRNVALKLLSPALIGNADAMTRFQREATAVASLKHQHIALAYDFGEHETQPYIAFEWIDGNDLRDLLKQTGRLPVEMASRLFNQIADALSYAHDRGVIHRDIKPANIIVSKENNATLVDFGLAWMSDLPSLTSTGMVFGTPLYMAPEQIEGKPVDQRTDVYSMAFVLYEMLAGRPPFAETTTPALLMRQLNASPAPLSEANPTLPAALDAVFAKATAKSSANRYASVNEFRNAVNSAMPVGEPTLEISAAKIAAHRGRMWLAGVGAIAMAAITLVGFSATRPGGSLMGAQLALQPTAVPSPAPTSPPAPPTATAVPQMRDNVRWANEGQNAFRNRYSEEIGKAFGNEARWSASIGPEMKDPVGLTVGRGRVVAAYENSGISVHDVNTGKVLWSRAFFAKMVGAPVICCTWDRGVVIVGLDDGAIVAHDLEDGKLKWRIDSDKTHGTITGLTLGTDEQVYATTYSNWVLALDGWNGSVNWEVELKDEELVHPPLMTNAGVYVLSQKNALIAIDRVKREIIWRVELPATPTLNGAISGDGSIIAIVMGTKMSIISTLSGKEVWNTQTSQDISGIAIDWGRVFVTGYGGTLQAFNHLTGQSNWQIRWRQGIDVPPITDGRVVVITDNQGQLRALGTDDGLEVAEIRIDTAGTARSGPISVGGWVFLQHENAVRAYAPANNP